MANAAARIFLKNGKSFPQLLRSRLVGRPHPSNVNRDQLQLQLLAQPLINPTRHQQLYLQRPVLGNGFNFVDFVVGKDQVMREGKMRLVSRYDDDVDDVDDDDVYDDDDDVFDDIDYDEEPLDKGSDNYTDSDTKCCE